MDDNRFQWQELRDGPLTVRWYRGDERFGRDMLGSVTDAVRRLSAEQGVDLAAPVTVHVYDGAGHAFANPSGTSYKADAAADAWQKSLAFLAEHLKGG